MDLHSSLIDCLKHIWPRLVNGAWLYTHEAQDLSYVAMFFDDVWWQSNLHTAAPGLIGAGIGIPVNGIREGSSLAYIQKRLPEEEFTEARKGGKSTF